MQDLRGGSSGNHTGKSLSVSGTASRVWTTCVNGAVNGEGDVVGRPRNARNKGATNLQTNKEKRDQHAITFNKEKRMNPSSRSFHRSPSILELSLSCLVFFPLPLSFLGFVAEISSANYHGRSTEYFVAYFQSAKKRTFGQ